MSVSRQLQPIKIKHLFHTRLPSFGFGLCSRITRGQGETTSQSIRTYCLKIKSPETLSFRHQRCVSNFSAEIPFNSRRSVTKHLLVFSHEQESFYKFLSFFGVFQMIMWGYLSLSPVQDLKSGPASVVKDSSDDMPWWKRWLYKEGRYKNAISGMFLTVGTTILFITVIYPRRAIKNLWLLKGGKNIRITTYSHFGRTQTFNVPLDSVNCLESRTGSGGQIPLKIKDKSFFFLVDKRGTFHHPEVFDFVIGLKRNL